MPAKKQDKKQEGDAPAITATVLQEFRDRVNFDVVYEVGDDVSDFDPELLDSLELRGLVEIIRPEAAPETPAP